MECPDKKNMLHCGQMIELETQIFQTWGSENTNPTNLPEESQTEDIKVTFVVFSSCW